MDNEQIAENIAERARQILFIPAELAEMERLRVIAVGIRKQIAETDEQMNFLALTKAELEQAQTTNTEAMLAATQRVDDLLAALYRPVDAPAAVVAEVKKRSKKAEAPAPPAEKHPCPVCDDIFYNKVDLVKHLRAEHRTSLEDAVKPAPIRSLCADCLGGCDPFESPAGVDVKACPDHHTEPDEDQVKWRDSTCEEWRGCQFQNRCFGPANEEDPVCFKEEEIRRLGEEALEKKKDLSGIQPGPQSSPSEIDGMPLCQNRTCAWSDLGMDGNCDADEQFRQGRAVTECKCFVAGTAPADGQDAAACFNTNCPSNDPELPNCCEEWGEVWECPEVVTAGWGKAVGEEAPTDTHREQHAAIVKAAIAAGDDINEHGVYRNPEVVTLPLPKKGGYKAEIRIGINADGGFTYGYDFRSKNSGSSGAASVTGTFFKTREAAITGFIAQLKRTWPEILADKKLKPVMDAVEDWQDAMLRPQQETTHEAATQEAGPEVVETEQGGAANAVPVAEQLAFAPLDEPIGDCELCQGYGVIDGELYGEFALVPCTCEAGKKVAGHAPEEAVLKCCEDCSIEDPGCASCNLPDMNAPFEVEDAPLLKCFNRKCTSFDPKHPTNCFAVADMAAQGESRCVSKCDSYKTELADQPADPSQLPRCASGPCTATGKNPKDVCLRVKGKECRHFVPISDCKHSPYKQTKHEDGSITCDLCDEVVQAAPEKSELTPLQQRCVHPKVFREETEAGVVCKACKLNLSQPSLL